MKFVQLIFLLLITTISRAQDSQFFNSHLTEEGYIPFWLVSGPYEQDIIGFGQPSDRVNIDEASFPIWGGIEKNAETKTGDAEWFPQSIDKNNFVDFNATLDWINPGETAEKLWMIRSGYAHTQIESETDQVVNLLLGSNSSTKVILNGENLFQFDGARNAVVDQDTIKLNLKRGKNSLFVKVGNSHQNYNLFFFVPTNYEWGFYSRLITPEGSVPNNIKVCLPTENSSNDLDVVSTFYFKKIDGILKQRFDFILTSNSVHEIQAKLKFTYQKIEYDIKIDSVKFGEIRYPVYLPAAESEKKISVTASFGSQNFSKDLTFNKRTKYNLHLMMLSHTDIGYTHTQPVVKELHVNTLDHVIEMCHEHDNFKWTIETLWQVEQFKESRSEKRFLELVDLIKKGRISVSPIYTNPFTGFVSAEEMIKSFSMASELKTKYGITYTTAVYNDVPGQSWLLPQLLESAGVKLLVNGINEVYGGYKLQKNLPKAFYWEAANGSKVINYRTETYTEGLTYGLERDVPTIEKRIWSRINKLESSGYNYDMILINSAFMDNSGIPEKQFKNITKWNEEYEYPKFICSNADEFVNEFVEKYADELPTFSGDWTSNWDILNQGEYRRIKNYRSVQHNILSAEKLSTINWMLNPKQIPFTSRIQNIYNSILHLSGHGSGLEYGYGSPLENKITFDFRESYIENAALETIEVSERSVYRLTKPEESLEVQGILVFNPLSWQRSDIIKVEFSETDTKKYGLIDLSTGKEISSYHNGYTILFVAEDLPPVGYKKFKLIPRTEKTALKDEKLTFSSSYIENEFYKIKIDRKSGYLSSIISKVTGNELLITSSIYNFNSLLIKNYQLANKFSQIESNEFKISIDEKYPVGFSIVVERENNLLAKSVYTLWNGIDRIDVSNTIDLEQLSTPEYTENYGVGFPFNIKNADCDLELLGGFTNHNNRLPGVDINSYSIRRSAKIFNENTSVSWATKDNRVVELIDYASNDGKVLISNIMNNFPENWNRREVNEGIIQFDYSFRENSDNGNNVETSHLGWEISSKPFTYESWYKTDPVSESYFNVSNEEIVLLTISKPTDFNGVELHLFNSNNENSVKGILSSKLFSKNIGVTVASILNDHQSSIKLNGMGIPIELNPSELKIIKINFEK